MLKAKQDQLSSAGQISSAIEPPSSEIGKRPGIILQVDTPRPHQSLQSGQLIVVSGWAAAKQHLVNIEIELGGARQSATLGIHRPDLVAAFPQVPALANAGFSASFTPPIRQLSI